MTMPGFSAEAPLSGPHTGYRPAANEKRVPVRLVSPQFCYCECGLRQLCFPIGGVWRCFYVPYCIPRGNCPPGYCQSGFF
jgi:hypothetical protein